MRHLARVGIVTAALAAVIGAGAISGFAEDKEAVIKERRDAMKRQGDDLKAISEYAKGDGDQATATAKINDLLTLNPKIVDLFVPGTGMDAFPGKTGAKPEIWKEWDKFKTLPAGLKTEEEKLAAAIKSGDKGAVGAQLAETGKNGCGGCHTPYREKLS
ncbi:MAG TPA: cytochrome c [Stellaceae bacterium]|jgi:cytochrome c556|nr:cytochrome c [Stellaceae bacterium]